MHVFALRKPPIFSTRRRSCSPCERKVLHCRRSSPSPPLCNPSRGGGYPVPISTGALFLARNGRGASPGAVIAAPVESEMIPGAVFSFRLQASGSLPFWENRSVSLKRRRRDSLGRLVCKSFKSREDQLS